MNKKVAALRPISILLLLITILSLADFAKANPPDIQDDLTPPPLKQINVASNLVFTRDFFDSRLEIQSDNIIIDGAGFAIKGNWGYTAINLNGKSNVTIKNLTMMSFTRAMTISGTSNLITIHNCTLVGNVIVIDNSQNNSFYDNKHDYSGITMKNSHNNTVLRNHFHDSLVQVDNGKNNSISQNSFNDCLFAIKLETSSNNRISSNTISNGYLGIIVDNSSENEIIANRISGSSVCGIEMYDYSLGNNITRNSFSNNLIGFRIRNTKIIMLANFSGNKLLSNFFSQNDLYGNNASITAKWDLPDPVSEELMTNWHKIPIILFGNYWSDYKGIDTDGDGVGNIRYLSNDPMYADSFPLMVPTSIRNSVLPLPKIPTIDELYDVELASMPIVTVNQLIQWSVIIAFALATTVIVSLLLRRHRKTAKLSE